MLRSRAGASARGNLSAFKFDRENGFSSKLKVVPSLTAAAQAARDPAAYRHAPSADRVMGFVEGKPDR
jgi:hypothetical protein